MAARLLPVAKVVMPASLAGQQNGKLDPSLLATVDGGGKLERTAARAWRALVAAAEAAGFHLTFTLGGMYRTYAQQVDLFDRRYTVVPLPGRPTKTWNGIRYYQLPGVAMAAVPGTSNHGYGLAVDTALDNDPTDGTGPDDAETISPALTWLLSVATGYGWSWELQSEAWHIRYVAGDAIPAAVLAYERSLEPKPAPAPTPKPTPQPQPTPAPAPTPAPTPADEEEPIMQRYVTAKGDSNDGRPRAGAILTIDERSKVRMSGVDTDEQAKTLTGLGLQSAVLFDWQYDQLLALAQRDAAS